MEWYDLKRKRSKSEMIMCPVFRQQQQQQSPNGNSYKGQNRLKKKKKIIIDNIKTWQKKGKDNLIINLSLMLMAWHCGQHTLTKWITFFVNNDNKKKKKENDKELKKKISNFA